ncbi:OB-fold domain-containing protein [Rhodococcus sp. NPDC079359]|uniref:Zn-ribbon domain-containing OB-fold protein n=1 Tax=Rhodococcus sp. NPDC079359 TaxID=3154961 RepID=UPI00344C50BE
MTVITDGRTDWLLDPALAPTVDGDPLRPLYDGAARGELVLPFCSRCDAPVDLDQQVCDRCGSPETDWRATDLHGTVHSATLMRRLEPGLVATTAPYPIVDVELRGGHRLIMTTVDVAPAVPRIGDNVRVGFRHLGGVALPAAYIESDSAATEPASDGSARTEPASFDLASSDTEALS